MELKGPKPQENKMKELNMITLKRRIQPENHKRYTALNKQSANPINFITFNLFCLIFDFMITDEQTKLFLKEIN
jgi:hypothetical protein